MLTPLFSTPKNSHIHVFKNKESITDEAAKVFVSKVSRAEMKKKKPVFVLPSSEEMIPFYKKLVKAWREGQLDMSKATCFSLYEFVGENNVFTKSTLTLLKSEFYDLISNKLTLAKLSSYGLRALEIDDLSSNLLKRFSLNEINEAIRLFKFQLVEEFNKVSFDSYIECEKLYWDILTNLQKQKEIFVLLDAHVFNHKVLPISNDFLNKIHEDMLLRKFGLPAKQIFHPEIAYHKDFDTQLSAKKYKQSFHNYLSKPKEFDMTIFLTLGSDSSEIGYNHLNLENEGSLSVEQAVKKTIRLIPLSLETKSCLSNCKPNVPTHVISFGIHELLNVNDVLVIAMGVTRQNSIYKIFSSSLDLSIPGTLLEEAPNYKSCFYIDENAYGYKAESKQNLRAYIQNELDSSLTRPNIYYHNINSKTLFEVPNHTKACVTLNPNVESIHNLVNVVSLPKRKKILFVKQSNAVDLELVKRLTLKKNLFEYCDYKNASELAKKIISIKPDIVFLPSTLRVHKTLVSKIKKTLINKKYHQPLLGIFYGLKRSTQDLSFPLSKSYLEKKITALKKFHSSQIRRTPFDLIVSHLADYYSLKINDTEVPNENFKTYLLSCNQGHVRLKRISKRILTFDDNSSDFPEGFKAFKLLPTDKIIAVSPHPDDVEIGMGGVIQESQKLKIAPVVLVATTGHRIKIYAEDVDPSYSSSFSQGSLSGEIIDKNYKTMIREFETMNALKFLNPRTSIESLKLSYYETKSLSFKDKSDVFKTLEKHLMTHDGRIFIFLPRHDDTHPTHEMTSELFFQTTKEFLKTYPDKKIYLAFYNTPWSGKWNLYHYNHHHFGNKLAALVGAELLHGIGCKAFSTSLLGGDHAERYFCFDIISKLDTREKKN